MNNLAQLKKANRETVIAYLRNYYWTKEHLSDLVAEIAESGLTSYADGVRRAKRRGDPTGEKAVKLAEFSLLPEMEHTRRVVREIERVMGLSTGRKADVLREYYFRRKPWQTVCQEMSLSKSNLYAYAGELVEDVAELLGVQV